MTQMPSASLAIGMAWRIRLQAARRRASAGRCVIAVAADARKLTNLRKAEKIGHDGLATAVLVGAIGMQPVAAAAGFEIDQRHRQVIAAEEPGEGARGIGLPLGIAVGAPRGEAGRDRRGGFHRLLIERLRRLAAVRRSCPSRPAGNSPLAPSAASSASAAIASRPRHRRAFRSPARSRSGPAAGARCRRQAHPRTRPSPVSRPPPAATSTGRPAARRTSPAWRSSATAAQ